MIVGKVLRVEARVKQKGSMLSGTEPSSALELQRIIDKHREREGEREREEGSYG